MKLTCLNSDFGLVPMDKESIDNRYALKPSGIYQVDVKEVRNPKLLRKYFALISVAYEYLPERMMQVYGVKESFRKSMQVAAGYFETIYDCNRNLYVRIPKSIAFDRMDESEFEELYERVKDVIWAILSRYNISQEEFESNLSNF